ncbi:hypothetical protein TWF281_002164 [Arthrobotrys megalospora]
MVTRAENEAERTQFRLTIKQKLPSITQALAKEAAENTSWPLVLRTAPMAIRAMAICLVASTKQEAGAIDIKINGLDSTGKPIAQTYQYLSTNLQHCSDLGRIAFSDAQSAMNRLMNYGLEMTGTGGLIADILEIIEDPEEAKFSLRPAMESLEENAERCKDEAESIHAKFTKLLDFIMALENAAKEQAGHTSKERGSNKEKILEGEENKTAQEKEIETLTQAVKDQRIIKEKHEVELSSATATVNELAGISVLEYTPPTDGLQEPGPFQAPEFEPPPEDHIGVYGSARRFLVGDAESTRARYTEKCKTARDEHNKLVAQLQEQHNRRVTEFMEQKKRHLDIARDDAKQRLQTVKHVYENSLETLTASQSKLDALERESRKREFELAAAQQHLATLREEGMNLDTILEIIRDSIRSLSYMKACIDDMKVLFTRILDQVKASMSGPLDKFLKGLNTAILRSGNAENAREIDNLGFTNIGKRQLTEQVLRLHGKIHMISSIAKIYVGVSAKYIKPAINKMEELAVEGDEGYALKSSEFENWCKASVEEIDELAHKETENLAKDVASGIWAVAKQTLAIEAPDGATD